MSASSTDKPTRMTPLASPGVAVFLKLAPITLAVFIAFLTIGLQLPVLPLHLKDALGMNATVVGVVVGAQFAAALLSRAWAGNFADLFPRLASDFLRAIGSVLECLLGFAFDVVNCI